MKLQPWLLTVEYVPGETNTMPDSLSRQEWDKVERADTTTGLKETDSSPKKHQSGEGRCGGPAPTEGAG